MVRVSIVKLGGQSSFIVELGGQSSRNFAEVQLQVSRSGQSSRISINIRGK